MARAGKKTVRFTQVVERSGRPQVHTLWLPPDKDPELQRAQKAHRVMTIEPGSGGSKADVGTIGFERDAKLGQYLIFPKSLKAFDGARVVGIKFDLVAQPKLAAVDPLRHSKESPRRRGAHKEPLATSAADRKPPAPAPVSEEGPDDREPAPAAASADSTVVPFEPPPHRETPVEKKPGSTRARSARPSAKEAGRKKDAKQRPSASPPDAVTLVREIRAAMKELERGKSVAAYQRLERAIADRG